MASDPIFRVTTYQMPAGAFSGEKYRLYLRRELAQHYFVMLQWGIDNPGNTPSADVGVRVTADPYGTGDLAVASGNYLQLERGTSTSCSADVQVTVVECLRDHDGGGFRLRDVVATAIPAAGGIGVQTVADTSATAWTDASKVVPFGGYFGGGIAADPAASAENFIPTLGVRITPSGTATLTFRRYDPSGTQAVAATCTTYVVEWGHEWSVDRATVTGTNSGALLDNVANYSTAALSRTVRRASTWVWACGYTDSIGAGNCALGQVATLGDGVTKGALESSVAVGCAQALGTRSVDVYVMDHAMLAVDYQFRAAAGGAGSGTITVAAATGTESYLTADAPLYEPATEGRLAYLQASVPSGAASELGQALLTARPTANTTVTATMADPTPTLNWVGWLLCADFAGVVVEQDALPTIRATTYRITGSTFSGTTLDLQLVRPLERDYFAMVLGSNSAVAAPVPADSFAWVAQDPHGTGDLAVSSGASVLRLERASAANPWVGEVVVVECLRGQQHAGFRLVDVKAVAMPLFGDVGVQLVNGTANAAWTALDRVVVLAGHRGGGVQPVGALVAADVQGTGVAALPTGTSTLQLARYTTSATALKAATFWCYVVEFGDEWQVQQMVVQAAAGGTDLDATGEYAVFYLHTPVNPARTMLWGSFAAEGQPDSSNWLSACMALGDGVSQSASELRVAVGLWAADAYLGAVYALTHPDLSVEWDKVATTGSTGTVVTVAEPARSEGYWASPATVVGSRWGLSYGANSSVAAPPDVPAAIVLPRLTGYTGMRLERDRGEGTWTAWVQTVDAGSIYSAVGAVQVADDDAGAASPRQYLVLQDPQWQGAANVVRATSQGGRAAGPVEADVDNGGSVLGVAEGTPTTDTALDFRLRGGAVGGSGGWLYRLATETTAASWKAMNALTTLWRQDGVSTTGRFSGHDVAYSTVYQRLLVALVQSATEIRIYYKDTDTVATGGWAYNSIVVADAALPSRSYCGMGLCELPDGTMLLAYQQEDQSTGFFNVTLYSSTDGGLNWSRTAARILNKTTTGGLGQCQGQHQLDTSGDWTRLAFLYEPSTGLGSATSNLYTVVSPDRGASWKALAQLTTYTWVSPGLGYPGSFPVAMAGLGDASGTFLLAYLPSAGSTTVAIATAARDDAWERNTDLNWDISGYATTARVKGLCFVRAPDRIWLFAWIEGTDASEIVARVVDPADPSNTASWSDFGKISGLGGVMRYGPHQLRGTWAGHRLVLSAGLHDPDVAAGADPVVAGHWMVQSGAYDVKPWDYTQEDSSFNDYLVSGHRLVSYQWWPCTSEPAGGGANSDALTPWTRLLVAGGTTTWTKALARCTAAAAADVAYYVLGLGTPSDARDRWGVSAANRGYTFHARLQVTSQRVAASSAEDMGVRVRSLLDAGVNGYDFTLRTGTTEVVLYDNVAATALLTVTTTDFQSLCEARVVEYEDQVWVAWRKVSDGPLAQWTTHGPYTVTSGALAAQTIRVGVLAATAFAPASSVIEWSDFAISYRTDAGQRGDVVKPTDMMGTRLNRDPVLVAGGLRMRWGGSGATDLDEFTATLEYARGYQNLSLDSPRWYWESASLVENELVFQADSRGATAKWDVDALLLVGTTDRTCTIQFSNEDTAAAWAAPAAEYQLDADLYTDLTVLSVDGSCVQLAAPTGGTFAPRRGELVGAYLRFTLAGSASGVTCRVASDVGPAGTGRWLLVDGAVDLTGMGVAPGAKAAVYGDRMLFMGDDFNRYTYFRLVLPDVSTVASSLGTYTGTHRLGAMVPGFWQRLEVPMDWSTTDSEQPNVTEYRAKGGAGWQYTEGPAQRVFRGTVVGDVQEQRRALRDVLRAFHGYSQRPIGLVLDSLNPCRDTVVYGRWSAGGQLDDAAWYLDSAGTWRTAGDADLIVTEEV